MLAEQRKVNERMARRYWLDSMSNDWFTSRYIGVVQRNWTEEERRDFATRLERGQDGDLV